MERSGGTEEEEETAGLHMHFAVQTQMPLRTSPPSSLSQLCGTDGGGESGTRLRGGCSDRFDHLLGFYIYNFEEFFKLAFDALQRAALRSVTRFCHEFS